MTLYRSVLKLVSVLRRAFPARFHKRHLVVRQVQALCLEVCIYVAKDAERDTAAEQMLSMYAMMFGMKIGNPSWYQAVSTVASSPDVVGTIEPLQLTGPAELPLDLQTCKRKLLESGIEIDLREFSVFILHQVVSRKFLHELNLGQANLAAFRIVFYEDRSLGGEGLQGDFRGATPLAAFAKLLPVIDLKTSCFDEAQLDLIIGILEKGDDTSHLVQDIVINPSCTEPRLLRIERILTSGKNVAFCPANLCLSAHIPPEAYERFAAYVGNEVLRFFADSPELNPGIRPYLAERRLKLGPPAWRHLVPGSVKVKKLDPPVRFYEAQIGRVELLQSFELVTRCVDEEDEVEDFPRDAFSDRSAWWQWHGPPATAKLSLYWFYNKGCFRALVENGRGFMIAEIENQQEIFGHLVPKLLRNRALEHERVATECRQKMETAIDCARLLLSAVHEQ